ncbi:hypothetical protein V6N13_083200 [Hibiscus sabdariffa]|uniref:Precorrin-2 dehydrogenase n=1 Tax=Hibiscus sabdariffa TaxID=183260 RepID=A0ABR2SY32_9ROSI
MPLGVERLARKYLRKPVVVTIGTAGKATDLVSQHVMMMMKESEKFSRLQKLFDDHWDKTTIVFVNTKKNVDIISKNLDKAGYKHMLIQSGNPVPPELTKHEASKFKPGTIPNRLPRRNDIVFAH